MKSRWETRTGKRILYCDFTGFLRDASALAQEIDAVDEVILQEAEGSVLLLADMNGTVTSSVVVELFKKSAARTRGYVKKQAVVGVAGFQRVLVQAVAWFSRETFVLFDTPEEALIWLAREDAEGGVVVKGSWT